MSFFILALDLPPLYRYKTLVTSCVITIARQKSRRKMELYNPDYIFVITQIYEIEATKPVQVHLKISSTNWQSAIVIPPVDQYKENTVLFVNDTGLTIR